MADGAIRVSGETCWLACSWARWELSCSRAAFSPQPCLAANWIGKGHRRRSLLGPMDLIAEAVQLPFSGIALSLMILTLLVLLRIVLRYERWAAIVALFLFAAVLFPADPRTCVRRVATGWPVYRSRHLVVDSVRSVRSGNDIRHRRPAQVPNHDGFQRFLLRQRPVCDCSGLGSCCLRSLHVPRQPCSDRCRSAPDMMHETA